MTKTTDIDPPRPDDRLVVVRIHEDHWWELVGKGMYVNGLVQLVRQPDERFALRIVE